MDRVDRCWKIDAYGRIAIDPGAIRSNEGRIQLTGSVHSTNPTGRRGASRHTAFWYRPHR